MTEGKFGFWLCGKRRLYNSQRMFFDPSGLASKFITHFRENHRIEVRISDRLVAGYVEVTTGPKPVFILIPNSRSSGSSAIITEDDEIVRIFPERKGVSR